MQHTNQAELNQLYGTFCRVWAAGGQATFSTTSLEGIVTAKLEVKLGQPTRARPGAPPPHLRTAEAFAAQHQAPASGAARRPRHRGPSAKAKSRARAAAYQAAKAAAAAAQESESKSTPATPGPGEAPSTPAPNAPLASSKPLNVLPLHLLQMGNALWCLWERVRGFPPSASWTGRTTPSRLPHLLPRWRTTSLFLLWAV